MSRMTAGQSLKITRAVTGTGYVSPDSAVNQTQITGIKQELLFETPSYPEIGVCKQGLVLTNDDVITAYKARQIGIYVRDEEQNAEILYFIAQSEKGTEVPAAVTIRGYSATWTFYFSYGQADNVEVTVDPSHIVTEDMLNEVKQIAEQGISTRENGEVVVAEDVSSSPFVLLSVFGKSEQSRSPTPNRLVEISSIATNGSVGVVTGGKNLCSETEITFTQSGTIELDYTLPAGDYYFSCRAVSNDTDADTCLIAFLSEGFFPGAFIQVGQIYCTRDEYKTKQVTLTSPISRIALYASSTSGNSTGDEATFNNIMLSVIPNSTFEGYNTVQTVTIATPNGLRGVPVDSGGNYTDTNGQEWVCDEIDLARGLYIRRTSLQTITDFSGADGLNYDGVGTSCHVTINESVRSDVGLCSNFVVETEATTTGWFNLDNNEATFNLSGELTLDEWKSSMTQIAPTILGALITPIETPLTGPEIEACKALTSKKPITTVMNNAGAEMVVGCVREQDGDAFNYVLKNSKSTTVVDNLESTSPTDALSANQGRVLNEALEQFSTATLNSLEEIGLTPGSETIASIAAAMPDNSELTATITAANAQIYPQTAGILSVKKKDNSNVVFEFNVRSIAQRYIGTYDITATPAFSDWKLVLTGNEVVDNLTSTATNLPLSANQGRVLFQSVSNGKSLVASAITDKGVATEATASFQTMADNVGQISTSSIFDSITVDYYAKYMEAPAIIGEHYVLIFSSSSNNMTNSGFSVIQSTGSTSSYQFAGVIEATAESIKIMYSASAYRTGVFYLIRGIDVLYENGYTNVSTVSEITSEIENEDAVYIYCGGRFRSGSDDGYSGSYTWSLIDMIGKSLFCRINRDYSGYRYGAASIQGITNVKKFLGITQNTSVSPTFTAAIKFSKP